MSRWTWITNVYLQPRKPTVPELRQKKCGQQVEQSGPASLLYTGDISPGVLCPHVESSVQKRHGHVGAHPEEGHKNNQWNGAPFLRGQAEQAGALLPGEVCKVT